VVSQKNKLTFWLYNWWNIVQKAAQLKTLYIETLFPKVKLG